MYSNILVMTDNLQNLRFYQCSSRTMINNMMFRSKIKLVTQNTVLKVSFH